MRRPLLLLGGVGIAAALHLTGALAHGTPSARARRNVTVHIRCDGARLAASQVNPDPVELVQGDSLDWVLTDSSDVDAFEIEPIDIAGQAARPWPFAETAGSRRGRRGAPALARGMRARAAGRYAYAVTARCGAGAEVTIDPIIIIRAE
jgi:hypothetical protein